MKKITIISLLIILILVSGLGSISSMAKITRIKFIGSSPGGTWYMVMNGVAEVIRKSMPDVLITVSPGEGATNPIVVANKEAELGLTHNVEGYAAMKGTDPFDKPLPNLRGICTIYGSTYQFVVRKDTGLKSVQDFIDKKYPLKFSVQAPGSGNESTNSRYFKEYGISYEDVESWGGKIYFKEMSESSSMLRDGLIDGFGLQTLHPSSAVTSIAHDVDLELLPLDPEVLKAMNENYELGLATIPAGTYSFLKEDYPTTITSTILVTYEEVSEELVYNITKAIHENLDYMRKIHVSLSNMSLESMSTDTGAPLHEGAKRYYEEQGIKFD